MKTKRIFGTAIVFLTLQLTALCAVAPVMPVVGYANIVGMKQGRFNGSAIARGYEGQIAVVNVEYDATDAEGGKVVIEKYPDASSNQFHNALVSNEVLSKDFIQLTRVEKGVLKTYQTYNLTLNTVKSIDYDNNLEKITFKAGKVEVQVIN